MAFAIPKIEYKNGSTSGSTTSGSGTIFDVVDTTDMEAGMVIEGAGIPAGATIASFTGTTVLLANSVVATATGTSIDLDFCHRIEFEYPPKEPKGEAIETKATISESLSGVRQVAVSFTEAFRSLVFSFLSQALYVQMDDFLKTHALLGESFRYYDDQTLTTYDDVELDTLKAEWKKVAPKGVDVYVWEIPLKTRRVL